MPVHDWTRAFAGLFHDFHLSWVVALARTLNGGGLPEGYHALIEPSAEAPPCIGASRLEEPWNETAIYARKRRTLVIRHEGEDRVVALVELVSPGNKDRERALQQLVDKAISALTSRLHLLVVDLHPPGPHDPAGIHGAIWQAFSSTPYRLPLDRALTLASYEAGPTPTAYVEPVAVGSTLPDMPLFLEEGWYVPVPLEGVYAAAFAAVPQRWRDVLTADGDDGPRRPPRG